MKIILFGAWGVILLSLYGGAAAYGYSPFGDGQNIGSADSNSSRGAAGGVFIGGYRSGPRHK